MPQTIYAEVANCGCCEEEGDCYLTIPPFVWGGGPYADLAAAEAVMGDPLRVTANCLAFFNDISDSTIDSFSASFNGTTLEVNGAMTYDTNSNPSGWSNGMIDLWAAVIVEAGETLSAAYALVSGSMFGFPAAVMTIYDEAGSVVETISGSGTSGTLTSAAITNAGCYTIRLEATDLLAPTETLSAEFDVTSSGVLGVGTVRAAYGGTPDYLVCVP